MVNILGIPGSLRAQSLNRSLLSACAELLPAGSTLGIHVLNDIPLYNEDLEEQPAAVTALKRAIETSHGVLISTPEYHYGISGILKNAIDWISRLSDQPFRNKPVALQSAAGGMLGGARMQYHLRQVLVFVEARVFTKPEVFVAFAKSKVDESGEKIADETTREMIAAQLSAFAAEIAG